MAILIRGKARGGLRPDSDSAGNRPGHLASLSRWHATAPKGYEPTGTGKSPKSTDGLQSGAERLRAMSRRQLSLTQSQACGGGLVCISARTRWRSSLSVLACSRNSRVSPGPTRFALPACAATFLASRSLCEQICRIVIDVFLSSHFFDDVRWSTCFRWKPKKRHYFP